MGWRPEGKFHFLLKYFKLYVVGLYMIVVVFLKENEK